MAEPALRRRRLSSALLLLQPEEKPEEKQERNVFMSGGPDMLQSIASFLPLSQQFGTMRTVSRGLRQELPSVPRPEPIFTVRFRNFIAEGRNADVLLGVHPISAMQSLLTALAGGEITLPIFGDHNKMRLHIFYTPVGVIRPTPFFVLASPVITQSDIDVGIQHVDPARRAMLTKNEPREFHEMFGSNRFQFGPVTIDQIVRGLWDVYARSLIR